MSESKPELRLVESSVDETGIVATLDLISRARESLVEAREMRDYRRIIEVTAVAQDAAKRAAKLAEAQHLAAEVVEAANAAANDAAAVRIEAQARAGELLAQMAERGERASGRPGKVSMPSTLSDLGVTRDESSRWQQVAAVPAEVRGAYVEETKAAKGEVSTDGLLRNASTADRSGKSRAVDHAAIAAEARKQVRRIYRELLTLPGYRPESLVMALDSSEKKNLLRALEQLSAWIEDVMGELAVHRVAKEE